MNPKNKPVTLKLHISKIYYVDGVPHCELYGAFVTHSPSNSRPWDYSLYLDPWDNSLTGLSISGYVSEGFDHPYSVKFTTGRVTDVTPRNVSRIARGLRRLQNAYDRIYNSLNGHPTSFGKFIELMIKRLRLNKDVILQVGDTFRMETVNTIAREVDDLIREDFPNVVKFNF